MAEPKEGTHSSFGDFSIQDTMEMGLGNKELLDGLLNEETVTETSENLEEIEEETGAPETPKGKDKKVLDSKSKTKSPEQGKDLDPEVLKKQAQAKLASDLVEETEDEEPESEEVEDDEEPKATPKTKTKASGEEDNRFESLSKDLFNLNVFTKDENEGEVIIKTPQDFLKRFNYEKEKGANEMVSNFITRFGEDYQNAFQAIFVDGANPKEYFTTYNNIENLSGLDITKEENQEAVVRQFLAEQDFEAEDINTEIQKLKNYGDLAKTSEKYHKVLVKKEGQKLQQLQEESKQKLQQQASIRNQFVQNVQNVLTDKVKAKEFDGIPISPKTAQELQDLLVVDKWKTPSGETLTDFDRTILELKKPENHQMKVKVALLLKILEKDPTLSTIRKSAITKESDNLFNNLAKQNKKKTSSQGESNPWTF